VQKPPACLRVGQNAEQFEAQSADGRREGNVDATRLQSVASGRRAAGAIGATAMR